MLNTFWTDERPDPAIVRGQLGLDPTQPLVSAVCNILGDSERPRRRRCLRQQARLAGAGRGLRPTHPGSTW